MDLVVLAGGLGTRFGGLKQIEPVDEFGNFIIDYSIFDAIRCGFNRVVFVINKNNYEIFEKTIGKRIKNKIKTSYVFQDNSNIPSVFAIPASRTKPFGTAHAILCAKDVVKDNFAVINADDFYGYDAMRRISDFLKSSSRQDEYAMVGYPLANTILGDKVTKRGVCITSNQALEKIVECEITKTSDDFHAHPIEPFGKIKVCKDTLVSMNLFGFKPNIFSFLSDFFNIFLKNNMNNLENCEFFISTFLTALIENQLATVKVLPTTSHWIGMTYKEDCKCVKEKLQELRLAGKYPLSLWT